MMIDMSVSPRALGEVGAAAAVEKSQAPVSRETAHGAAALAAPATSPAGSIELVKPTQNFNPVSLGKVTSELDTTVELMVLLFRIAQKAREMGVLQRDSENTAIIDAQKSQVAEMRSGANLMIAMAVISGIMAVVLPNDCILASINSLRPAMDFSSWPSCLMALPFLLAPNRAVADDDART